MQLPYRVGWGRPVDMGGRCCPTLKMRYFSGFETNSGLARPLEISREPQIVGVYAGFTWCKLTHPLVQIDPPTGAN
jgi:hypothetical protein